MKLKYVIFFAVMIAFFWVLVIYSYKSKVNVTPVAATYTPKSFREALNKEVSSAINEKNYEITISRLTDFTWDTMYLIEPYTFEYEIENAVGDLWSQICTSYVASSDSYSHIIFTYNHEIVHCIDIPRNEVIFNLPKELYLTGISIQDAFFIVDDSRRLTLAN